MTQRNRTITAFIALATLIVIAAFLWAFTTDVPDAGAQTGWEGLRQCESSGNYSAQSGQYSGAYQFDAQTHRSVGGDGYAGDDSPAEQDAAAQRLYAQRGAQPWPVCGRHLSGASSQGRKVPTASTPSPRDSEPARPAPAQQSRSLAVTGSTTLPLTLLALVLIGSGFGLVRRTR